MVHIYLTFLFEMFKYCQFCGEQQMPESSYLNKLRREREQMKYLTGRKGRTGIADGRKTIQEAPTPLPWWWNLPHYRMHRLRTFKM